MGIGTVEIITGRERRRRWSVADKLRILAECDAPGVQVAEVAARHGVYRSLVFQWRRQARDGTLLHRSLAWVALGSVRPGRGPLTLQGHPLCRSK